MTRAEIIDNFRTENPDITDRVITDALLDVWCKQGDKTICAITRCIVDQDGTTIFINQRSFQWIAVFLIFPLP